MYIYASSEQSVHSNFSDYSTKLFAASICRISVPGKTLTGRPTTITPNLMMLFWVILAKPPWMIQLNKHRQVQPCCM